MKKSKLFDYGFPLFVLVCLALLAYVLFLQFTGIQEGTVYQKDYIPAHVVEDENALGTPEAQYRPAQYILRIEANVDDQRETNWFEVPSFVFQEAQLGDLYSNTCVCIK